MSVEDEFLIHKLVARYADAVNRRDRDAWAATWAPDGIWTLPGRPAVQGREAIVEFWVQAMSRLPFVVQLIYHGVVDVGPEARGTWYLNEHMKLSDDAGAFNIGCYQDRYTKADGADGEWLFAERRYTVLYNDRGAGDMSGATNEVPSITAPGSSSS